MIRALYTAASGMVAQTAKQDIIANNIANAQTTGFKRLRMVTTSFAQELQSEMTPPKFGAAVDYADSPVQPVLVGTDEALDLSEGPIHTTDRNLDFAIQGPGAFEVVSSSGSRQTRAGNFQLGPNGELQATDGGQVQGKSGTIHIPKGDWQVTKDGTIVSNGAEVDKIKILGEKAGVTTVSQGCLESANVSMVSEMVEMITNMRLYEANQKVIVAVDQTLDKLVNEAGKV